MEAVLAYVMRLSSKPWYSLVASLFNHSYGLSRSSKDHVLILNLLAYLLVKKCIHHYTFFAGIYHQKNILEAVLSLSFLHDRDLDSGKCLTVFCLSYGDTVNSTAELSILTGAHSSHQ